MGVVVAEAGRRRAVLETAKAAFLERGDAATADVPEHVVASWRRSASNGVRPDEVASEYFAELDTASRLVRCAQPVMAQLCEEIRDIPACVALTDNQARILCRKDTSSSFSRLLDHVYFAQGFGYAEGAVGTNGVGTVLEFGRSVQIVGAEHFVDSLHGFSCAGAPVHDPLTGRVEGVLDISCSSTHSTPILHSLVRAAALAIERALLLDRDILQQALFDAYSRLDGRVREAVLAVGHRVVMANPPMQTLLAPADLDVLQEHLRYRMTPGHAVDDHVDLPSGNNVRIRGSTVGLGRDVAGVVATVRLRSGPLDLDDSRPPRRRVDHDRQAPAADHLAPHDGTSPAWRSAAVTAEVALRRGVPLIVFGEPASGRATLLGDLFGQLRPSGRIVVHDACDIAAAPARVLTGIRQRHGFPTTLHVLRDVDRVPGPIARHLVGQISGLSGAVVAATSSAATSTPFLELFRESVTVPPLRNRGPDLERLARALLAQVAPGRDVRLGSGAVRLIVRFGWPGNLGQLREALAAAVVRRPVGTIDAGDLPAFCQSAPRSSLRHVDELERDAIVEALREATGNRVAAATALGLARSTLYRKIRQYGITV